MSNLELPSSCVKNQGFELMWKKWILRAMCLDEEVTWMCLSRDGSWYHLVFWGCSICVDS